MKKISKIMAVILCVAMLLCVLTACGTDGTYYLMNGDEKTDATIVIDGDEWSGDIGSGTVEIDGKIIEFKTKLLGQEIPLVTGEIKGKTITFNLLGEELVYSK